MLRSVILVICSMILNPLVAKEIGIFAFFEEGYDSTRPILATPLTSVDQAIVIGSQRPALLACKDALILQEKENFATLNVPIMKVVGQRDWIDCSTIIGGQYSPLNRLDFIRKHFFLSDSLGGKPITVERQSLDERFPSYAEHTRWITHGILFVTINLPSPDNHYITSAGRNQEFEERTYAIQEWLEGSLQIAKQKKLHQLFVVFEGNPFQTYPARTPDPFKQFRHQLRSLSSRSTIPITLIFPHTLETPLPSPLKTFGMESPMLRVVTVPYWDLDGQWLSLSIQDNASIKMRYKRITP